MTGDPQRVALFFISPIRFPIPQRVLGDDHLLHVRGALDDVARFGVFVAPRPTRLQRLNPTSMHQLHEAAARFSGNTYQMKDTVAAQGLSRIFRRTKIDRLLPNTCGLVSYSG
jgi:hypothetical protein